ncbi:hypothetical protein, partial [Methylomonas albis]
CAPYPSHPGAIQPYFGCLWCKFSGLTACANTTNPEKSRHRLFGINFALF